MAGLESNPRQLGLAMVTGAVTAPVVAHIGTNRKLDSLGSGVSLARFQILARELKARAQYLAVRPWTASVCGQTLV